MSYQYYPTGAHTAALMWSKFKKEIKHLCDPSAGKGHLIRHAQEGFAELSEDEIPWLAEIEDCELPGGRYKARLRDYARQKFSGIRDISVVEIDIAHHSSLKELGAKVVGYDFLDVKSLATVSHIIMNPPFKNGAEHVLHAWDVTYDAEVVAIVNASTIRNPHTQDRQRLVKLIEMHGSVEFHQSQFVDDVERKTDVEVALIYLEKVPQKYIDVSSLLDGLNVGDNLMGEVDPEVCTALALPSNFIQDTCFRFSQAVQAARIVSEALSVSNHLTNALGITLEEMQSKGVGSDFREIAGSIRQEANDDFKKRYDDIKKRAWSQILRSSLLTSRLSNQARRKIEASSASIYELEFSAANIYGFLTGVIQSMGDIYTDMIVDLFDSIIERSSDNVVYYKSWKSNTKHRIGMRIRKTRFIIPRFHTGYGKSLDYESMQFLSDIDKVFGYLHGVTGDYDGLVCGFSQNEATSSERISTRYFDFRYYKGTGTIHFFPKSEEVVNKINSFVGKIRKWIPGDMNEANSDFKKQYEKGESMTKDYLDAYRSGAVRTYGRGCPAYALLREIKGDKVEGNSLDCLENAIDAVHENMGLKCGAALTSTAPLKMLTSSQTSTIAEHQQPEQLQLLAA